jgi:branched-chain amino acid transport system permease protein
MRSAVTVPAAFRGSWDLYDVLVNKFRGVALLVGLVIFTAIQLVLQKTKLGIVVRAGVENKEIVAIIAYLQRLGTDIKAQPQVEK